MTRWAVNADIFSLSPQRTPSTWQRQISRTRCFCLPPLASFQPCEVPSTETHEGNKCVSLSFHSERGVQQLSHGDISQRSDALDERSAASQPPLQETSGSWRTPGKLALSTAIKNRLKLLAIISAFQRRGAASWQISSRSEILSWENTSRRAPPT